MEETKTVLVVSAHAADFVWRAGGAIALYAERGYKVRILCLSYGERGESERLWKIAGMTVERVKEDRHAEVVARRADSGRGDPLLRYGRLPDRAHRGKDRGTGERVPRAQAGRSCSRTASKIPTIPITRWRTT